MLLRSNLIKIQAVKQFIIKVDYNNPHYNEIHGFDTIYELENYYDRLLSNGELGITKIQMEEHIGHDIYELVKE